MNGTNDSVEQAPGADCDDANAATIDAFHRGRFHLVQPKGKGHRAGLDAMLLAALVPMDVSGILADFGAGAGAAGMAVACRNPAIRVVLVERSAQMAGFARRSIDLEQNARFAGRVTLVEADVTLKGADRLAAGLVDSSFDHVIMNPPFNSAADRTTPDALKAEAHAMPEAMFEQWIRSACAVCKPSGQLSLIARPQSLQEILQACEGRFGGLQVTPVHPRLGEDAVRILLTGIKGNRARLALRAPLFVHEGKDRAFSEHVDKLVNGRSFLNR